MRRHRDLMTVVIEQFWIFPGVLDKNDVLAILVESTVSLFITHARIIGVHPRVCDDSMHGPGCPIFRLQEVFFNEAQHLCTCDVFITFIVVDLEVEFHMLLATKLWMLKLMFNSSRPISLSDSGDRGKVGSNKSFVLICNDSITHVRHQVVVSLFLIEPAKVPFILLLL